MELNQANSLDPGLHAVSARLALPCLLFLAVYSIGADETPVTGSLQTATQKLACAADAAAAARYINNIKATGLFPPGIPSESDEKNHFSLQASTLDTVLHVLYQSAKAYPENKNLIEQTVIRWNYCSIIDNGKLYDHKTINETTIKTASAKNVTDNWTGFNAFGLLQSTVSKDTFDFTTPYIDTTISGLADRQLQRRYIAHCLPHPEDKNLYRDKGSYFISRIIPVVNRTENFNKIDWNLECNPQPPVIAESTQQPTNEPTTALSTTPSLGAANVPVTNAPVTNAPVTNAPVTREIIQPITLREPENETTPSIELLLPADAVENRNIPNGIAVTFEPIDNSATDTTEPAPIVITGPAKGNAVTSTNASRSTGLSGSVSLENRSFRLKDTSLKLAFSYKPVKNSYWFLRSAFNISQQSKPLTYSWGIGYDDWHPGTWGAQINHWGPLRPGDGFDLTGAVAELSYKLNTNWLKDNKLSSSIALTKPLKSNSPESRSTVNWGLAWNPYSHWFIRSTLSKPLGTNGLNWSYGFGYTRYNHNSLSFEYNNWGLNKFPDHNFRKNGQLSLIYRWSY